MRTLLSGYLLSSQGDRMLMAHSVEGRFPFLDRERGRAGELAAGSLQAARAGREARPEARRRGPGPGDRSSGAPSSRIARPMRRRSSGPGRPNGRLRCSWSASVADAGIFEPSAVARLWRKCSVSARTHTLGNADNMALVGVLSTSLLHEQLVRGQPSHVMPGNLRTVVDLVDSTWPTTSPVLAASIRSAEPTSAA